MNELGYSGLANDGPMNIAPHRQAPPMESPVDEDLSRLWARDPERPMPFREGDPPVPDDEFEAPYISLTEATERIEQLEVNVERLRDYVSVLTLALSEHIVIPSVAGDGPRLIRVPDFYQQGAYHTDILGLCLQGGHRTYPVLTPHEEIEGRWQFLAVPDFLSESVEESEGPQSVEESEGPPTAWDRISSDD
jgi:hypothetical protein